MSSRVDQSGFENSAQNPSVQAVNEAVPGYQSNPSATASTDTDVQLRAITERDWERRLRTYRPPVRSHQTALESEFPELPEGLLEQSHCRQHRRAKKPKRLKIR